MSTDNNQLPPLPEPEMRSTGFSGEILKHFSEQQMHAYVLADRAQRQGEPVARDREADRQHMPDPAFNDWLDESITENAEFTVWHSLRSTGNAYAGWVNSRAYLANAPAEQPAEAASPLATEADFTLEEEAVGFLRDMIAAGDEPVPLRFMIGLGHSGFGVYVCESECPEEGTCFVQALVPPEKTVLIAAPATAEQPVSDALIREVFMRNGFTIKEGQTDLKPYVYAAARALLAVAKGNL